MGSYQRSCGDLSQFARVGPRCNSNAMDSGQCSSIINVDLLILKACYLGDALLRHGANQNLEDKGSLSTFSFAVVEEIELL